MEHVDRDTKIGDLGSGFRDRGLGIGNVVLRLGSGYLGVRNMGYGIGILLEISSPIVR